jgi:hypothetical protein
MILELNARPGLAIQIANGNGLLPRLQAIEALVAAGEGVCRCPRNARPMPRRISQLAAECSPCGGWPFDVAFRWARLQRPQT